MSWKGFQKAVVRMPQLVKQKTGMADGTTDPDFDDLQQHFEGSLKAVGRLADHLAKYRAAMQQWAALSGDADVTEWHELETIVAHLSEYLDVLKTVSQKVTKRNHKLIDFDRHRNAIRALQANKNRSVSEERAMVRAEEAFQQAQREYDEWNNLLKQELPVLLECQQQIVKPIYAQLLSVQKRFFTQTASLCQQGTATGKQRPTEIVVEYEGKVGEYYERLGECQMTRVGGLSATSSRHTSNLSLNGGVYGGTFPGGANNTYSNKPLPQPNVGLTSTSTINGKSIDQMVSEMQINTKGDGKQSSEKGEKAKALFDFVAQQPGDLSFQAGATIHIIERTEHRNDWWRGRTVDGREGIFPGNYVS